MIVEENHYEVGHLGQSWTNKDLRSDPEYQRGLVWSKVQKQRLVDSVFRGYPLPSFYLREKTRPGVDGKPNTKWEVIDGQQRIEALAAYRDGQWEALDQDDPRLALPEGVKTEPCPWGGKTYKQLPKDLRDGFDGVRVPVVLIKSVTSEDEVRDLFIRLQAGTALTRQQIRDAWPGPIGPFIETIAGRRTAPPTVDFLSWMDRRGIRRNEEYDDAEDPYVDDRQTCAQLLALYIARELKPGEMPTLLPRAIDDMYHTNTGFDPDGSSAQRFTEIVGWCEFVLMTHPERKSGAIRKALLFSLFMLFEDISRAHGVAVNDNLLHSIGHEFWMTSSETEPREGKIVYSTSLTTHYGWFVRVKMAGLTIPELDSRRTFDESQRVIILGRQTTRGGPPLCAVCKESLEGQKVEFDHYPTPWILGGRTDIENGRAVHGEGGCHKRGRAALDVANLPIEV